VGPIVSVVTVTYNAAKTLRRTLDSVRNQTYPNVEHIVIDAESTDGTRDILRSYDEYLHQWISEPDEGLYDAMNKGIQRAEGELIGMLNGDDVYLPTTIETVVRYYRAFGRPCVVYGDLVKFAGDEEVRFNGDLSPAAFRDPPVQINHPTCFVHRSIYEQYGGYDTDYDIAADRELLWRFHTHNVPFVHTGEVLAKFRLGGTTSQYTLSKALRVARQKYRLLTNYDVPASRALKLVASRLISAVGKAAFGTILPNGMDSLNTQRIRYLRARKVLPDGFSPTASREARSASANLNEEPQGAARASTE